MRVHRIREAHSLGAYNPAPTVRMVSMGLCLTQEHTDSALQAPVGAAAAVAEAEHKSEQ